LLDAMLVERGATASHPAAPFLQAARAELLARLGQVEAACAACDAALAAARSDAERDLLRRRRAALVISHPDRDAGHDAR
jgi:predicted RNA polymerase sigma factor